MGIVSWIKGKISKPKPKTTGYQKPPQPDTVQEMVDYEIAAGRGGDIVYVGEAVDTRGTNIPVRRSGGGGGSSGGGGGTPTTTTTSTPTPIDNIVPLTPPSSKPSVYLSGREGWMPERNPNAVVIYLKGHKTTGRTSVSGFNVPKDFDVSKKYYTDKGTIAGGGSLLAGSIYQEAIPQQTTGFDFKEYAKEYGVKTSEVARFESMGYSGREAFTLAQWSKGFQMTPSPDTSKQILKESGIKPEFKRKPFTWSAMTISETTQKGLGEFGTQYLFGPPKPLSKALTPSGEGGFVGQTLRGGLETAKFGILGPFHWAGQTLGFTGEKIKGESVGGSRAWAAAPVSFAGKIIPSSPVGVATFYGGMKFITAFPKIAKVGFTGSGIYEGVKAETPEQYVGAGVSLGFGLGSTILKGGRATKALFSLYKATKTPFEYAPGTPLRERATVILKTEKGEILYQLEPKGTYILPGGAIDKGEPILAAAKRELFEEMGIKGVDLVFKEVVKTPRQSHHIFEAIVDKKAMESMFKFQAKEVAGVKWIKPPKYSGPTMLEPFGRKPSRLNIFGDKIVKAEDLFLGARSIYPDIKQTELVIGMQQETFLRRGSPTYLAKRVKPFEWTSPSTYLPKLMGRKPGQFMKFQKIPGMTAQIGSRYDIPFEQLKPYFKHELWYTRGGGQRIKTELLFTSKKMPKQFGDMSVEQVFKVSAKKMKRGEKVMYFQPPTTGTPLTSKGYLGIGYLGLFQKPSYEMGISMRMLSPQIQRYKAQVGRDLIPTQKAIRGKEFEVGKEPGAVFTIGDYSKTYLGGRKVEIITIKDLKMNEVGGKSYKSFMKQEKKLYGKLKKGEQYEYYSQIGKRPVTIGETISYTLPTKSKVFKYTTPKTKKKGISTPYYDDKPIYNYGGYKYPGGYKYLGGYDYKIPGGPPTPPPTYYYGYGVPKKPGTPPPPIVPYEPPPEDKLGPYPFGRVRPGKKIKKAKKQVGRPFYRPPSLAALGLKGTKFQLPTVKKRGKFEITGLQTRYDIPGAIKLEKSKKKKGGR